jgi:DNA-nicking Smr family endonuclease
MHPTHKKNANAALNEEEIALFRETIGDVEPVAVQHIIDTTTRTKLSPRPKKNQFRDYLNDQLSDGFALNEPIEQGETLSYLKPSNAPILLRKLKRGQFSVASTLDLHGMTIDEARNNISQFFNKQRQEVRCCVRIVHGKGNRSLGQIPVLKRMVNHWLPQREDVIAFCSAPAHDGGTGAVYVLLQKR